MRRSSDLIMSGTAYRVIEVVVILVLVKLAIYAVNGFDSLAADLPFWRINFLKYFFNAEYFFVIFVLAAVWTISAWFSYLFVEMEGDELLLDKADLEGLVSDRTAAKNRLAGGVFTIGAILVMFTSLVQLDLQALPWGDLPMPRTGVSNVVVYFLLAMALLSLSHFSARRAAWAWERIPISDRLARNWLFYSLILFGLVALVAFILPTRYTIGLLTTLGYMFEMVTTVVYFLLFIISTPFLFILGWLFSLLGRSNSAENTAPPPPVFNPPEFTAQPGVAHPWIEVLRSIVFWTLLIGVVVYAMVQYTRQNKGLVQKLRSLPGISWLAGLWAALVMRLRGFNTRVAAAVQSGLRRVLPRRGEVNERPAGFTNVGRLSYRQRVLFFYLTLVQKGAEYGLPRKPSQTPLEYAQALRDALPVEGAPAASEANAASVPPAPEQDLYSLTEAFMEARYSQHEVGPEGADRVRRYWDRLRRALRRRKGA